MKIKFMRLVIVIIICSITCSCNQAKQEEKTNTPDPSISNLLTPTLDTNLNNTPPVVATAASTNLFDIWVLDSIDNKPMNPGDYTGGTPYVEFSNDKGKFNAHSGCNSIKGVAVVKENNLKIENLEISKNSCKNKALESSFIKAIADKKASYKIENDKLYLTAGGAVHIFRRIRR
jgi:heat shock protein HslJ